MSRKLTPQNGLTSVNFKMPVKNNLGSVKYEKMKINIFNLSVNTDHHAVF